MNGAIQPTVLLLREGTDTSQGIGQAVANINACQALVRLVRTTLGPRGMDKLVVANGSLLVSNDGATVLKALDGVHPAARTLVEISRSSAPCSSFSISSAMPSSWDRDTGRFSHARTRPLVSLFRSKLSRLLSRLTTITGTVSIIS